MQQPVQPKDGQKPPGERKASEQKGVAEPEQKVASNVEVKTTPTAEGAEEKGAEKPGAEASLPKCIGPGCENDAQPDSVYCGNDCILRHAAAAMKSISDDKEPKQERVKPEKSKSAPKVTRSTRNKPSCRLESRIPPLLALECAVIAEYLIWVSTLRPTIHPTTFLPRLKINVVVAMTTSFNRRFCHG